MLAVIADAYAVSGLTQAQLADLTTISRPQISKILRGLTPMTVPELVEFCTALNLKLSDVARLAGL